MCNAVKKTEMKTEGTTQAVYLRIPPNDWSLLEDLARKFGWQVQTKEQQLAAFIERSRGEEAPVSEEEIMDEVRAVRYEKK